MSLTGRVKSFIILVILLILQACVIQAPPRPDDPYYAPVISPSQPVAAPASGSLYSVNSSIDLFSDRRARRVGDTITVLLQEQTASTKASSVSVSKESEIEFNENSAGNTILGSTPSFKNLALGTDYDQSQEFDGAADANQSNSLSGNITVTVSDILPNGNLVIRGEKWITLNRGEEFIRITGIVNPDDVTGTNTVISSRIANARIAYSGTGELAQSQQMGWLNRFFNSPLWPF